MKIAVKQVDSAGAESWEAAAGTPQEVADLLDQGREVGPLRVRVGRSDRFLSANWLFVGLKRSATAVVGLIDHPFTVRHAGLIWVADAADRQGGAVECLIGFPLKVEIASLGQYLASSNGLAAIYGEAQSGGAVRGYRVVGTGAATALTGSLDSEAVARLENIGRESREHAGKKTRAFLRSTVRLDPTQAVSEVGGGKLPLASLDAGARVHCPVHLDLHGVAQVIGSGNSKGVQCPICQRNYWVRAPGRRVDFTHFRRVFGQLCAEEAQGDEGAGARQFTLLREPFLPPLKFFEGVTLIRSPMGTGKTQSAVSLVEACRSQGLAVLVIGHRRSLLRALAQRLGLDLYFETLDGEDGSASYRAVAVTEGYAICLDSVPTRLQPDIHKFDVVIVDESEQAVRHLAGGTLKENRRLAIQTFKHYVAAARAVYLLDAHLGDLTLAFVLQSADPSASVRFVVNEPPVESRQYELVATREGVLAKLAAAVAEGKKCYVATNSKERAIATALFVATRWPDRRVMAVTRENAQLPEVQAVLCNLADEFQSGGSGTPPLDVLIGSPAIGTGIDITFEGGAVGVDHVFGIFEAGITTHFDIDQQIGRVRNPGCVSVWICPETLRYETSPDAIRHELKKTVARTDALVGFERNGLPIYSDHDRPLIDLWAEIAAVERASKNALFDNWTALREGEGWTGILADTSDDDKERGATVMAEGKRLREAERAQSIAGADDIDSIEGERLEILNKKGGVLTAEQLAQLAKWHLREFYVQDDVDAALVAFDDGGRTRRMVEVLEILVGDADANHAVDRSQIDRKEDLRVIAFDRQFRTAKAEILDRLLVAAGLVDGVSGAFNVDAEVHTAGLAAFVDVYRADQRRIQSELGLDMRSDIDRKAVQQLGAVLRLIGVGLTLATTKKVGGAKQRGYRINADKLVAMMDVVARRADRQRERWDAKRQQDAGDNGPPVDLEEIEQELSPDDEGGEADCEAVEARLGSGREGEPRTTELAAALRNHKAAIVGDGQPKVARLNIFTVSLNL